MAKWTPTGDYGIRYREHLSRTTGVGRTKRPLRYFVSVYKWKGKTVTDTYGWEGDDFRNYDDVVKTALTLRQNRRHKTPPFTLKELLELREQKLLAAERERLSNQEALEAEKALIMNNVFAHYCDSKHSKISLNTEKGYYNLWIKPLIGHKKLDDIALLDLERIKMKMLSAGKAARSIQYVKSIVRQVYNFAAERRIYNSEVPTIHFLKKQKIDNKRQRYLSPDEASLLLEKIKETSLTTYQISLLSLNSGMRFGEIASLLWQHIDTLNRTIHIIAPKNEESRSAFMNDEALGIFRAMKKSKPNDLVFPAKNGKKMIRISNTFTKAVNDLKLNERITDRRMRVVFHTLRHSCASWLVNSGVELPVIAKILGHKSISMTMRYSHVNDTSVQDAMRTLDQQQKLQKALAINSHK